MSNKATSFRIFCPLDVFEKADAPDGQIMRIGGVVSTDQLDKQGERIVQAGLDFQPFINEGWYNDNHGQKTRDVLGYPTDAFFVRKGDPLPNGRKSEVNGWWAEGFMLDTTEGRKTFELCQAMAKSPRKLGFSIEGSVKRRSKTDPTMITRATVRNVAITHCPVNCGTEMHALVKSLIAGSAISNPGQSPGEGFALRTESLDEEEADAQKAGEPPFGQEGSAANEWEAAVKQELNPSETTNLAAGPGDDANNGGWAGLNPHTTAVRSPTEGLPPRLSKAEKEVMRDFRIVDELDIIAEWAPILRKQNANLQAPARLTKAESRIIVAQRLPYLTSVEVDQLIDQATDA